MFGLFILFPIKNLNVKTCLIKFSVFFPLKMTWTYFNQKKICFHGVFSMLIANPLYILESLNTFVDIAQYLTRYGNGLRS